MRPGTLALVVVVAVLAMPLLGEAQPPARTPRLGVLLFGGGDPNLPSFQQGLRDLGYVEGQNLLIDYRSADGVAGRLPELAADLVRGKPDVIAAFGGDVAPFARRATATIPIVMLTSGDPVKAGLVTSLAHPGGNVTGVTLLSADLAAKRIQFLKEAAPAITRVGVLWNPEHADDEIQQTQAAARALGVQIQSLEMHGPADLDGALQAAVKNRVDAVIVVSSRQTTLNRVRILEFARSNHLPLAAGWGEWTQGGALFSYGPDLNLVARRAATYVDKVLRGSKPADLPVEQPTRIQFIVNVATARGLGLTVPPSLLQRADEVVE